MPRSPRSQRIISIAFSVLCLAGFGSAGGFLLWLQNSGPATNASVTRCDRSTRSHVCYGTWTTGALIGGGRVQMGIIEGATDDQVGQRIAVRVHGDRAYAPALRLPIIFFVLAAMSLFVAIG